MRNMYVSISLSLSLYIYIYTHVYIYIYIYIHMYIRVSAGSTSRPEVPCGPCGCRRPAPPTANFHTKIV